MTSDTPPEAPLPAGAADNGAPPPRPAAAAEAPADAAAPRSTPQTSRRLSRLASVSEDSELAHMEAGGGLGGAGNGGSTGGSATGGSPSPQLPPAGSVSAFGSASLSLMGPRVENGEDSARSKGAPPSPGGLAATAAATLQHRMRRAWAEAMHVWWGLPSACKLTMVLAVVNFCISCAYAIVGLMLPNVDEEIHISITIIVSSVFVVVSVVDAVIYENTLELAAAFLLDTLVLARMIWFASRGSANASFKWTWVSIMCAFQVLFMITAVLAWRQFGWRLYGKLGVDFREKGAASRMRKALQRNAYVTVLKINVMFLCVLSAIGVDVSVEKRNDIQASIMAISLVGLFVGIFATWVAAKLTLKTHEPTLWKLAGFHCLMALALAQPIAVLAIYNTDHESRANATVSLNVGGGVYIFTSLLSWLATIRLIRRNARALSRGAASMAAANSGTVSGDPRLAPMQAGAWLGKPTQRNPRKIRFFQLSHDGSTLRWGWNKFVRLYYVDDLICNDEELTISLAFPFEAELVLKFPDATTYQAWRRGFAHLLLCLMAPDAPGPAEAAGPPHGQQGGGKAAAGWGVVGRTTSRGLLRSQADSFYEAPDSVPGRRNTSSAFQALQKLGVRVQELGRRVAPRQRPSQTSSLGERPSRRATAAESEWAGLNSEGLSGSNEGQVETPRELAEQREARAEQAAQHDAAQQAKRQRMVAYLQSVAQQHPTNVPPVVLRREREAVAPSPPSVAPQRAQPPRRRRRLSEETGGHVRVMVSVGVQTDESALQQLAYRSLRAAAPSTPPHAAPATAAPLSVPRGGSEGGDAEIAAQYAAAMAAAGGGGSGRPGPPAPAAAQPQQGQQAQQGQVECGSDADIASQWMAAMVAAGGAGGAAAAAAAPFGSPQEEQQKGAAAPASSGGDEDVAAQYLAAMQAAMGPGGASPPAAQQPPPPQGRPARQLQHSPPTPGSEQPTPAHSQRSITHYSLPASASPLEQLAWQQQQRSLQQLQQGSPASGTSAVWHGGGTPGWNTPQRSQSLALGAGLWQLAAAVDVIDFEELSFGKLLGAGAEGAVYAAWFLESPVAVKKFNRVEDSLHEVQMYLLLGSHDNIVALRGLCQHEGSMYLVLEYCPRGTLDVLLHHTARNPWDPQKLLPLIRSIARGMHYLHSRNILHRDLKPANIFVGHGQLMKIGDFGMARIVEEAGPPALRRLTPGVVGTLQYSAPELLNEDLRPQGTEDAEWALKLDVWSFGVTVWEILERRRPFEGLTQNAVQAQWMSDPYSACLPPVRLPEQLDKAGKRIYRGLADLVEDCTRLDPFARPSFRDILLRLKSLSGFAERQDMPPF